VDFYTRKAAAVKRLKFTSSLLRKEASMAEILAEEWQSPEAGKGRLMGMPWLIVATDLLSM
jgi:hypothetical protein